LHTRTVRASLHSLVLVLLPHAFVECMRVIDIQQNSLSQECELFAITIIMVVILILDTLRDRRRPLMQDSALETVARKATTNRAVIIVSTSSRMSEIFGRRTLEVARAH